MLFELQAVSVHYKNKMPALHGINLTIDSGSKLVVIGPTGAGKTTFMKLLRREIMPTFGSVYFKGVDYRKLKGRKLKILRQITGSIQQNPVLIPEINVFENIFLPLVLNGFKRDKANKMVLELMAELRISYLRSKFPDELSIGETKLVAAARALVHNPQIILADEPTENLDDNSKINLLNILSNSAENGATLVITTHDHVIKNSFKSSSIIYLREAKIVERI